MDRIVTQIGKRAEALKKIRKIKISVTTREILVAAGVAQPARADGCDPAAAVCPLCQRDIAAAVSSALDRLRYDAGVATELAREPNSEGNET